MKNLRTIKKAFFFVRWSVRECKQGSKDEKKIAEVLTDAHFFFCAWVLGRSVWEKSRQGFSATTLGVSRKPAPACVMACEKAMES